MEPTRLPEGHQPYDRLNAVRIGAVAGGLLAAPLTWLTGAPWFVIGGAIVGGLGGLAHHRRAGGAPIRDYEPPVVDVTPRGDRP